MHIAKEDLKLEQLTIIIPGKEFFKLAEDISVCGIESINFGNKF